MLRFNSVQIGSAQPRVLADFYAKVFGRPADFVEGDHWEWRLGDAPVKVGGHSEMNGSAKEPARLLLNFETVRVWDDFERIRGLGAPVVTKPYEVGGGWIATLADPDGNYFQLTSVAS